MQTEKDVKEINSAPVHSVLCAQGAPRENVWYYLNNPTRINTEFASSCSCTNKYIQNDVQIPILESILEKTVGYVLSENKQLRNKSDVHHYIGCIVC